MSDEQHVLAAGRHLRLVRQNGWEYVERVKISGIVGVVAVTPEGKLLLVEQYRPPVQNRVIELPAGLAGDIAGTEDEDLAVAARRELEEETGYRAAAMTLLTAGPPSSGLTSEIITLFLAEGLEKTGDGGGDEHEEIRVHAISVPEVPVWLEARRRSGLLIDLRIYTGLFFLASREKSGG